ncbi:MAG: dihydrodipicolinate synthase family protein [Thermodesulfobacteriota bacterium]
MMDYPPRGLIANLVTPLNRSGRPDAEVLIGLMRRLTSEISAFLAGSLVTGEAFFLEAEERLEILAAAVEACSYPTALFFEVTGRTEEDTLELLTRAERLLGASPVKTTVFFLLTPLVYRGNRNLPQHLSRLGRITRRRLVVSTDPVVSAAARPGLHHKNLRTEILKKISTNEQIVGLVFQGRLNRALNYQRALKLRAGFRFYDGDETNFLESPSSSGLVSCGANLVPQAWADVVGSSLNVFDAQRLYPDHLHQIWQSGRIARTLHRLYRPKPAAFLKQALRLLNILPSAALAAGQPGLDDGEIEQLTGLLRELNLL